jgi:hypothetical protein
MKDMSGEEIADLLNRCWMTHDGMWFFHCYRTFGIGKANEMNKAAIRSLAPMEIERMGKVLGMAKPKIENDRELRDFFSAVTRLFIPDFMAIRITFPEANTLRWDFEPGNCFAFKGMKRIGAVEGYECGVILRLRCWFDCLGLTYRLTPPVGRCLMVEGGNCSGVFEFDFRGS